jgi:hypothetical protein
MQVPNLVLTKTHCTGYCDDCSPRQYIISSADQFEEGCRTVDSIVNGKKARLVYEATVPVKAVHLIRDPFDNLVARLHLSLKNMKNSVAPTKELESYTEGREGLLAWCKYIDSKFAEEERDTDLIHPKIKELIKDVPCHAEWCKYSDKSLPILY